jgi:hypothetical protein
MKPYFLSELAVARTELATLTAKAESVAAAYRLNHGDDMAMVSGTRRKPNHRADARKWNACDREADAWSAVSAKAAEIELLEHHAKIAKRDALVPYTVAELKAARHIRTRHGWHEVVRVSVKSVTVRTCWSWNDRVMLADVIEVRS